MPNVNLSGDDLKFLIEVATTIKDEGITKAQQKLNSSASMKKVMEEFKSEFNTSAKATRAANACTLCAACSACGLWFPLANAVGIDGLLGLVEMKPKQPLRTKPW